MDEGGKTIMSSVHFITAYPLKERKGKPDDSGT
jgi:hypothetical protein